MLGNNNLSNADETEGIVTVDEEKNNENGVRPPDNQYPFYLRRRSSGRSNR